jgi:hypothetical protein
MEITMVGRTSDGRKEYVINAQAAKAPITTTPTRKPPTKFPFGNPNRNTGKRNQR